MGDDQSSSSSRGWVVSRRAAGWLGGWTRRWGPWLGVVLLAMLPCTAIVALSWNMVVADRSTAEGLRVMIANNRIIRTASELTAELQRQRLIVTVQGVGQGMVEGIEGFAGQAGRTGRALSAFELAMEQGAIDPRAVEAARRALSRLGDERGSPWSVQAEIQSQAIDGVLKAVSAAVMARTDRGIGKVFGKIALMQNARESAARLQTLLVGHGWDDPLGSDEALEAARQMTMAGEFVDSPLAGLGEGSERLLAMVRGSQGWRELRAAGEAAIRGGRKPEGFSSREWLGHAREFLDSLKAIEQSEQSSLDERLVELMEHQASSRAWMWGWGLMGLAGSLATLVLLRLVIEGRRRLTRTVAMLSVSAARLEQARLGAESATRSKDAFLAHMSHEIRTPMTAILGFTELMLDPAANDSDRVNGLHVIQRNGRHLLQLINDILDLSKIEAGKMEIECVTFRLRRLLYDVVELLRGKAEEKGLQLLVRNTTPVPAELTTDPTRLKQVLVNLISNAIKFTSEGSVTLELSCDAELGLMRFDVTDTGIGISPEQMGRLFEAFTQADASTTRRFGGTGLGLAITRQIVELLGGSIRVRSEAGVGSTFSVTLLMGEMDPAGLVADGSPEAPAAVVNVAIADLPRVSARVLLVEDGPDNQRLLTAILRKAGAEVSLAGNGQEGLDQALHAAGEGRGYDVILMDMHMPVMDGLTATRLLRERGYGGRIFALTAHALQGEIDKCLEAGCDRYLSKPIDRKALLEAVSGSVGAGIIRMKIR